MTGFSKKIIHEFIDRGHFKSEQSVRNFISKIRTTYGLKAPQNSIAQIAARIKGFSIMRILRKEEREAIPSNISEIVSKERKENNLDKTRKTERPSFKRRIKISQNPIEKEAFLNARAYPEVYILENKLRKLILEIFKNQSNWWANRNIMQKDIQEYSERIKKAEKRYSWIDSRGNHPIYYVNLEHLFRIIEKNWKFFKHIFPDQGYLRTWFAECIPIRNLIAHNIKTKQIEREDLKRSSAKILKLINAGLRNRCKAEVMEK